MDFWCLFDVLLNKSTHQVCYLLLERSHQVLRLHSTIFLGGISIHIRKTKQNADMYTNFNSPNKHTDFSMSSVIISAFWILIIWIPRTHSELIGNSNNLNSERRNYDRTHWKIIWIPDDFWMTSSRFQPIWIQTRVCWDAAKLPKKNEVNS